MKKAKWWLRIVGVLYLLLGSLSLLVKLFDPRTFAAEWIHRSYPVESLDEVIVRAFVLLGLPTSLVWLTLSVLMLYLSRDPSRARMLVVIVAVFELFVWVPVDVVWLMMDMPAVPGVPYLLIHAVIGVTGILLARQMPGTPQDQPAA